MNNYCVYLTIYKGNKLPPFYIGYTSIENIEKGYHGTVTSAKYKDIWRREIKENKHFFYTKIILSSLTKDQALEREEFLHCKLNCASNELYINQRNGRKSFAFDVRKLMDKDSWREKIKKNHKRPWLGKKHTVETISKMTGQKRSETSKQKMSLQTSGTGNGFYGRKHSKETLKKMSVKIKCPHCGKEANAGNIRRWHMDKCKGA